MVPHFPHFGSASVLVVLATICNSGTTLPITEINTNPFYGSTKIKDCKQKYFIFLSF
jgi:hypothetical protein